MKFKQSHQSIEMAYLDQCFSTGRLWPKVGQEAALIGPQLHGKFHFFIKTFFKYLYRNRENAEHLFYRAHN